MEGQIGSGGHIQFLGSTKIEEALKESLNPEKLYKLLRPYVDQAMLHIEGEIQERAPAGASTELKRSITHSVSLEADGMYGSIFIQPESKAADYAIYVEEGRAPGKMPPVEKIIPWALAHYLGGLHEVQGIAKARGDVGMVRKTNKLARKTPDRDKAVNSMAWGIAKHIAKFGTPAQHFFEQGWTAGYPEAERIITAGIDNALAELA